MLVLGVLALLAVSGCAYLQFHFLRRSYARERALRVQLAKTRRRRLESKTDELAVVVATDPVSDESLIWASITLPIDTDGTDPRLRVALVAKDSGLSPQYRQDLLGSLGVSVAGRKKRSAEWEMLKYAVASGPDPLCDIDSPILSLPIDNVIAKRQRKDKADVNT